MTVQGTSGTFQLNQTFFDQNWNQSESLFENLCYCVQETLENSEKDPMT